MDTVMPCFAITPIVGREMLKSERFWARSLEYGLGRAMGRLEERFEVSGHAYAALGASYRVDEIAEDAGAPLVLSKETLRGTIAPQIADDEDGVNAVWTPT